MRKIDQRKIHVLKIIVEEYIKTWDITGSKSLLKKYDLQVSSATVRSDMAHLEKMWLIFQPYNSAWRLPTTRWLRVFVDYLMETMPAIFIEAEQQSDTYFRDEKIDDILYNLVCRLTKITKEITFATIPSLGASYYLGLSRFLEQWEWFSWKDIYNAVKVLENKHTFIQLLKNLSIEQRVSVFIGEENIIPELESSTMIVKKIKIDGFDGYIWVLGSLKMDYAFNIATLRQVL